MVVVAVFVSLGGVLFFAPPTRGANFTVTNTNDSGAGSLRQAILDANTSPGLDTIDFNIRGAGGKTIAPFSALPTVTDPVIIDGYTQAGSAPNTQANGNNATLLIELNGTSAGSGAAGLHITAGSSTVRGLVINRFDGSGISLDVGGGSVIVGNLIGTDASGNADLGNANSGVSISASFSGSSSNTIGGTAAGDRNIISGNNLYGVSIDFGGKRNTVQGNFIGVNAAGTTAIANGFAGVHLHDSNNVVGGTAVGARNVISGNGTGVAILGGTGSTVRGNYIGTNAAGTAALGNAGCGVGIEAFNNMIGGTAAGAGNVISGNGACGVGMEGGNTVQGNLIGTNAAGNGALGNGSTGITLLFTSQNALIGGTASGAGNTIAHNAGPGVFAGDAQNSIISNSIFSNTGDGVVVLNIGNAVLSNSISANGGLGIDFSGDGVGISGQAYYPVLAPVTPGSTSVQGKLTGAVNTTLQVQVFSNAACDPSGFGEGQVMRASASVTTDGNGGFTVPLNAAASAGEIFTATATDTGNTTSEFSACIRVAAASDTPTPSPSSTSMPSTTTATFTATAVSTATPTRTPRPTRTPVLTGVRGTPTWTSISMKAANATPDVWAS